MKHKLLWGITLFLLTTGLGAVPAVAQTGVWTTEFYNNSYLIGPAALTRQDSSVSFDWGTGSPGTGVNSDTFTARFASDPYFEAGTYRFYLLADDQVRLNVGYPFHPQLDTFDNGRVGEILSVDIPLTAGVHHVQVDYREVTGAAYVYVTWVNIATNPSGPNFPIPQSLTNVNPGGWTAQYYTNIGLAGSPIVIQSEASPSHDWGNGSPAASIAADNFSARWTSLQYLESGTYQLSVHADDGVRIFVDGIAQINEWHDATGTTYVAEFNLFSGDHNIMIEYYERAGLAYMTYNLYRKGGGPIYSPTPVPVVNTAAFGTVITANRLNVRDIPSAQGSNILTKINLGETYPVVGRNTDSSWWQINVNGLVGWAYGRYLSVANGGSVPVTNATATTAPQLPPTGYTVTALTSVNIRSGPGTISAIIGLLPYRNSATLVGRNADTSWWEISYGGVSGWVNSRYAVLDVPVPLSSIPITG
ncbi:MAG: SH3 domain-containing protein [Anaerolineaceae bacterium]|nr:SH3 domain-containing protein [Anaerolineaceae bacterium]